MSQQISTVPVTGATGSTMSMGSSHLREDDAARSLFVPDSTPAWFETSWSGMDRRSATTVTCAVQIIPREAAFLMAAERGATPSFM
jgi:hypothetical protein